MMPKLRTVEPLTDEAEMPHDAADRVRGLPQPGDRAKTGILADRGDPEWDAEVQELRARAAWYREFAERAGEPWIWDARMQRAAELDQAAERMAKIAAARPGPRGPLEIPKQAPESDRIRSSRSRPRPVARRVGPHVRSGRRGDP